MNTNIADFGARGDGRTRDTATIQQAIDACAQSGGGTVTVPAGTYLTGTLWLRDNVELHLAHGSVLLASDRLEDYNPTDAYPQNADCPPEGWCGKHLILAVGCRNVALTGTGRVVGAADAFFGGELHWFSDYCWGQGYYSTPAGQPLRPGQLICFVECQDVFVADIRIERSTCWSLFLHGCDRVQVRGISVRNHPQHVNTDGIDIDCCSFVTVEGCLIDTGDDAIAIRGNAVRLSDPEKCCEYVTVANCVLRSSASAVRIGVGSSAIRHIRLSGLIIRHAGEGILLQSHYPGGKAVSITDVTVSDITGESMGTPIAFLATEGEIRRITFRHFRSGCECKIYAEGAAGSLSDLRLDDVEITDRQRPLRDAALARQSRGSSIAAFHNVQRLCLHDCRFVLSEDYFEDRPQVLAFSDCQVTECDVRQLWKGQETPVAP